MVKLLNWQVKEAIAKKLSVLDLISAIDDCLDCIGLGIDEGYYLDEASVYRRELQRRGVNYV
jgi:hypothetical protein